MLEDAIRKLATGKNIAAVTTLLPDGTPMTQPLWIDADDDHLLLSTEVHRQKFRNVSASRIAVGSGTARTPTSTSRSGERWWRRYGARGRAHIDELARKYTSGDYAGTVRSERVILKVAPTKRQFIRDV